MTVFYLGTHRPKMLFNGKARGPMFASVSTLRQRKSLFPRATVPWALDSAGFWEVTHHGGWTFGPSEYVVIVDRVIAGLGMPDFIAIQDYMCEDMALKKTGLTVTDHQHLTIRSYLDLCELRPDLPWLPVIQGRTASDYYHCIRHYSAAGVDLTQSPRVGLGSVCRRQATNEIAKLVNQLGRSLKLHGFGVKLQGLANMACNALASSDSLAWSAAARRRAAYPPIAANDQSVAEAYRDMVTATLSDTGVETARGRFRYLLDTVGVKDETNTPTN